MYKLSRVFFRAISLFKGPEIEECNLQRRAAVQNMLKSFEDSIAKAAREGSAEEEEGGHLQDGSFSKANGET